MRIAHRIWINEIRSRNIRQKKSFGPSAGHSEAATSEETSTVDGEGFIQPESNIMLHQVHDAVESLPEAQRLVMQLVGVEVNSYREPAEILEVPMGTIMSRLAQARPIIGKRVLRVDQNNNKSSKGSEVLK
jgi:RNA polymerase sigma-70 factor (ECF subfamily)